MTTPQGKDAQMIQNNLLHRIANFEKTTTSQVFVLRKQHYRTVSPLAVSGGFTFFYGFREGKYTNVLEEIGVMLSEGAIMLNKYMGAKMEKVEGSKLCSYLIQKIDNDIYIAFVLRNVRGPKKD